MGQKSTTGCAQALLYCEDKVDNFENDSEGEENLESCRQPSPRSSSRGISMAESFVECADAVVQVFYNAKMPTYGNDGSVGADLYTIEEDYLLPGEHRQVPFGLVL
ncbi:hypothetical protein PR048_012584 [Dryococelus australis]|uniref:Uncharacterized protein n=1 Tax=Dryococelus australis TaxID=614101 RepID=A0ABQ9HR75_9NEOP|nr:hypothetical protein PR048_012584 [Dryococelus australis]